MMNSEILSTKSYLPVPKWLSITFLAASFVGFIDSVYLTANHYLGAPLNCSIINGCEKVLTSSYSIVWGIPVAVFGVIFYFTLLVLAIAYLDAHRLSVIRFAAKLTPFGLLASLWFIYLQLFVIRALCLYCLLSAATSTLLFILGVYILKKFPSAN